MQPAYLVTGVSGSGKSTLCAEFVRRGQRAYDLDEGYSAWIHHETGEEASYTPQILATHDWIVQPEKIKASIGDAQEPAWFFGSAHNLHELTSLFAKTFLLEYPNVDVLRHRILTRTNNDYGKAPGQLEEIINYSRDYERRFIDRGAHIVDCTLPIDQLAATLLSSTSQ